ncbi:hypothetical protein [Vibrio agarivorans]|uniref:Coil containing protein n=1 Tax=Vibrio agarivorans TaxID=153622 RepID=A0ABT7Y796_9VIBR|nr:hypothetical protein [Vibrio agarivorans]MDN2483858.1 hypothetical protein [Vibrio agarivorans]
MSSKMLKIQQNKIRKLVASVQQEIVGEVKADISAIGSDPSNMQGTCILLADKLNRRLIDNGINSRFVGGKATFGINTERFGVVDFGYEHSDTDSARMESLYSDGSAAVEGMTFFGHAWVECKKAELLIDLSLLFLKSSYDKDNTNRGLHTQPYKLDESKVILEKEELTTRTAIIDGMVGYSYSSSAQVRDEALKRLALIEQHLSK